MKRLSIFSLFIALLFAVQVLVAEILETDKIATLLDIVDQDTLVILDLNDTLMGSVEYEGSDSWAKEVIQKEMQMTGLSKQAVYDYFVPKWHKILLSSPVKAIEPITSEVIAALQDKEVPMIGLTARYIEMAYPTHNALHSIGIDLAKSTIYATDIEIEGGYASKFIDGVVFVGLKNDKGQTLLRFLDQINYQPKRVVFVDDKLPNVQSVEQAMQTRQIPFTGMHYTAACSKQI